MKVSVDTNVLVRALTEDDIRQSKIAQDELTSADEVIVVLPTLCELAWVLSRGYKIDSARIAMTIRSLIESRNISTNRPAVDAGLALLDAGGDFADGVIAFEGKRLGADSFISFDRKAVTLLTAKGETARLLS